jgi:hypothetical protein
MKTREDEEERRQENGQARFVFQDCPYWAYIKKINTFTFWCMVIPHVPLSVYT